MPGDIGDSGLCFCYCCCAGGGGGGGVCVCVCWWWCACVLVGGWVVVVVLACVCVCWGGGEAGGGRRGGNSLITVTFGSHSVFEMAFRLGKEFPLFELRLKSAEPSDDFLLCIAYSILQTHSFYVWHDVPETQALFGFQADKIRDQ